MTNVAARLKGYRMGWRTVEVQLVVVVVVVVVVVRGDGGDVPATPTSMLSVCLGQPSRLTIDDNTKSVCDMFGSVQTVGAAKAIYVPGPQMSQDGRALHRVHVYANE